MPPCLDRPISWDPELVNGWHELLKCALLFQPWQQPEKEDPMACTSMNDRLPKPSPKARVFQPST